MTIQQGLEQIGINRLQQARQHWQKGLEQITATTAFTWHSSRPARTAIAAYATRNAIKLGLMALVELDLWTKASITRLEGTLRKISSKTEQKPGCDRLLTLRKNGMASTDPKASITRLEDLGSRMASTDPKAASALDGDPGSKGVSRITGLNEPKGRINTEDGVSRMPAFDMDALKRAAHPGVSDLNGTHSAPDGAGSQGMTNDPATPATTRSHPQSTMDHGDGFEEDAAAAWAET